MKKKHLTRIKTKVKAGISFIYPIHSLGYMTKIIIMYYETKITNIKKNKNVSGVNIVFKMSFTLSVIVHCTVI